MRDHGAASSAKLDNLLELPGSHIHAQLQELQSFSSESLLGKDALTHGLMSSLKHNVLSSNFAGVGEYHPSDPSQRIDYVNSYANQRWMSRKTSGKSTPPIMHVLLDMPERIETLSGDFSAFGIGRLALGMTATIAEVAGSEVHVYLNDGQRSAKVFEGFGDDMTQAYRQLNGIRSTIGRAQEPTTEALLDVAYDDVESASDAVLLVSDFADGYDDSNRTVEWSKRLKSIKNTVDDRLWVTRITSPSHSQLYPGVTQGMSLESLQRINSEIYPVIERQNAVIDAALKGVRMVEIDTMRVNNPKHPVKMMTDFMLGRV